MLKKSVIFLSTSLFLTGVSMPSFAQDLEAARQAIEDALPGTLIHNPLAVEWESRGDDKKIKIIKAETSTGQALSARVKKRKQKPWDVVVSFDLDDGVKAGEQLEMHFFARTKKAASGKETAEFTAFVGRNKEPYDNVISETVAPSEEWEMLTLKRTAEKDIPAGQLKVEYQIGQHAQTIEFGPVYVSNLGPAAP